MAVHRAGRFIYLNPAAVRLLGGHSPDAFLGQPVLEVVAPEARARVKERLRQLYEERKPVPFLVERLVRRDGSSFLAEVKGTPIDYGGEPAVLVVLRDVTAHVQERLDLIQSEARYRSLVEEINDVIFQLDARGCITFISPAVERLYGWQVTELMGRPLTALLHPDDVALAKAALTRKTPGHQTVRLRTPAGSLRYVQVSLQRLKKADTFKGVLGVASDITALKKAEAERERLLHELEAKNRELEQFTYTVSHDLKSPLFTIQGFLGLLEEDCLTGDRDQILDDIRHIRNAAETMQQLLDDLLELSRIGRTMNPPETLPLQVLLESALDRLEGMIREKNATIAVAPDLPVVYGDRMRLVEVFQNLVENALKYGGTATTPPHITVEARPVNGQVEVRVRDNGPGIPPRYHEKVFGLFERLDNKTEGTGIGLTLVKRIVEVHGGRIWIESAGDGSGCTFCFTLPAPPAPVGTR
ncbi:MAG: hypothetical protein KatS3mg044_0198 [Rhodothermaceae bacterium]|nr:MAG: hypothetical protein KatS3mg044_0198 [Rhodothermaceae bacterium]